MKLVIQRVSQAAVRVAGEEVAKIRRGLLLFIGVERGDTADGLDLLARKVANLRVFEDSAGKMNLSVQEIGGEVLVVSQFTLAADLKKGTRPSFDTAEEPAKARPLIENLLICLKALGLQVQEGRFGAKMEVTLTNDGPATFLL